MKLEKLNTSNLIKIEKEAMKLIKGGEATGAGGMFTGNYVEGKGWEYENWSSDERGVYRDEITGEEATYFRRYDSYYTYFV